MNKILKPKPQTPNPGSDDCSWFSTVYLLTLILSLIKNQEWKLQCRKKIGEIKKIKKCPKKPSKNKNTKKKKPRKKIKKRMKFGRRPTKTYWKNSKESSKKNRSKLRNNRNSWRRKKNQKLIRKKFLKWRKKSGPGKIWLNFKNRLNRWKNTKIKKWEKNIRNSTML